MAKPTQFRRANLLLRGNPEAGIADLPCETDGTTCTSVWQLSEDELENILMHGRVRVTFMSGSTPPPHAVYVCAPKDEA